MSSKTKYEIELERATSDKRSRSINKFSGAVRALAVNNLDNGDIVTIPEGYKVFEQEIPGNSYTAEYLIAKVKRGVQEIAVRFYPSSLMKIRTKAKPEGDHFIKDGIAIPTGNVVLEVQEHADLNEAVDALVGRPFRVNFTTYPCVKFESREKDILTKDDLNDEKFGDYSFE